MRRTYRTVIRHTAMGLALLASGVVAQPLEADVTVTATQREWIPRDDPREAAPTRLRSPVEREAMHETVISRREAIAALIDNDPPSPPGRPPIPGREARLHDTQAVESHTPGNLVVFRNTLNTIGSNGFNSTIHEPAAASDGLHVFYTGNWYASYSTNGGTSWTEVAIPAGPAAAPNFCCDIDVVHDAARGLFLWVALYCDNVGPCDQFGALKLFVQKSVSGGIACSYTFDFTASGQLPDYPKIGISQRFAYVSSDNVTTSTWANSQVRRVPLDELQDCVGSLTTDVYTYDGVSQGTGQRVFTPSKISQASQYWASLDNGTTLRLFKWPEGTTSVTETLRTVMATAFTQPDCRGGVGDLNVFQNGTAWSIRGFRVRTAVAGAQIAVFWNASADAIHSQFHLHGAVFQEPALAFMGDRVIANATNCMAYPMISANERNGHFGLSLFVGGRAGGGGTAARGFVSADDEYTPGIAAFVDFLLVADGTHNPESGRLGDYFTVTPDRPCGYTWAATSYALNGGNGQANVNPRWVVFGRERDHPCWFRWKDAVPALLP